MSDTFAKLYERDGKQLLITKETSDEDGCPEIHLRTTSKSGHTITLKFGYEEDAWDGRDKVFDGIEEDKAWDVLLKSPGVNP